MTGFDDLERQLRGKVAELAPRRRWPLIRTFVIAAAVLTSAGAVTAAATGVIGGPDANRRASNLLNDVGRATEDVPACRPRSPDRRPALLSSLPASDLALRAFPQLRRPPTGREREFARSNGRIAGMKRVLSGGARELKATDGSRFMLTITAGRGSGIGRSPDCVPVQLAELQRRAPTADPQAFAIARRSLEAQERAHRENLGREGLVISQLRPDGSLAGAAGTYTDVAVRLGTASIELARVDGNPRLVVSGLVPATVDHVIIRSRSHPDRPRFRRPVPQQVFRVMLPARYGNRISVQWRAADGRALRTMKLRW